MLGGTDLNFTLKQLRYVEAAGRTRSITNAATQLCISQSSVTAAIDALEDTLGFDLFIRAPAKGISLTPAGAEALGYISTFLQQTSHLASDLQSIGGEPTGVLRLACYMTAAPYVLPLILTSFVHSHPGVSIELSEGDIITVGERLLDGSVDLACTYGLGLPDSTSLLPLFRPPPYAVIGAEDSLASQASVTLEELVERPMILLDLPFGRNYYLDLFRARGLKPNIVHTTRSAEMARALVAAGFGFSLLNLRTRVDDAAFVCRPINASFSPIDFGVASNSGVRHPRIVTAFLQHCKMLSDAETFDRLVVKL